MKLNILTIALLSFVSFTMHAQQDPVYSQYMFTTLSINPAYAGSREVLSLTGLYRKQWIDIDGAPSTQYVSADFLLKKRKIGLGIQAFNDVIGIIENTGFYASYAYRIQMNKGVLSLGLQGGVVRFKANYANVKLSRNPATNDDVAFAENQNEFRPNFGAGIYFHTDRFYVGLSVPHILGNEKITTSATGDHMREQPEHWFATAGLVLDMSPNVKLKPSVLARAVSGSPFHMDFNTNLWLHDVIGIGVSYRTDKSIVGILELQINPQLRIGYAYDYTMSALRNPGSHEVLLRYEFGYNKKNIVSPRYF